MIIVITGPSGAGKTTAIRSVLENNLLASHEFPEFYSQRRAGKSREAFNLFNVNGNVVCAIGTYNKESTNRQGADTFLFSQKEPLAQWILELHERHDHVIYDVPILSPGVMKGLQEHADEVLVVYLDTPSEVCIAAREERAQAKARTNFDQLLNDQKKSRTAFEKLSADFQKATATRETLPALLMEVLSAQA